MSLRLTVREDAWRAHLDTVARSFPGLVPVVKGNGYGFGRRWLAGEALRLGRPVAVGTVFEAVDLPGVAPLVVLTPTLTVPPGLAPDTIVTVGARHHLEALARAGWAGPVLVKVESAMRRYGRPPAEAVELVTAARRAGLEVVGLSLHPPLAGTASEHASAIEVAITGVDPGLEVWVSHLDAAAYASLVERHAERSWRIRLGTALWHGDKSFLHLDATVLDVRPVRAGERAGYWLTAVPADGSLVMVGAGSAHGVAPLPDGRSPFHFARRRLALLEPPHMHTSMLLVSDGGPVPAPGDRVDVQRPLTQTLVDEVVWT
jgi:alanine racemase